MGLYKDHEQHKVSQMRRKPKWLGILRDTFYIINMEIDVSHNLDFIMKVFYDVQKSLENYYLIMRECL